MLHESLGALDRLESTITSLLALARHDDREPSSCDVAALVRGQVERWEPSYVGAGRELSMVGSAAYARIDPAAVRHILDVLLDNALHHGQGRVEVGARRAGQHIEIDVADEGPSRQEADPFSDRRAGGQPRHRTAPGPHAGRVRGRPPPAPRLAVDRVPPDAPRRALTSGPLTGREPIAHLPLSRSGARSSRSTVSIEEE